MTAEIREFGEFELYPGAYELRHNGVRLNLERIPFELLCLLVQRAGQLVTREEILERIWGKGVFVDGEASINTAIRKIRRALADDPDAPHFVLTVPAKGYRFIAPVLLSRGEAVPNRDSAAVNIPLEPATGLIDVSQSAPVQKPGHRISVAVAIGLLLVLVVGYWLSRRRAEMVAHLPGTVSTVGQKVGFCKTADGVRIAYAVTGQGAPVIQTVGWFTSVGDGHNVFAPDALIKRISAKHLLVRYDGRGSGLSDRGLHDYSLEPRLLDLEAVVDVLGLKRFALYGDSSGGPLAIAYAARYPQRVTRLLLYGSWAGFSLTARQQEALQALSILMRNNWGSDNVAFRQIFTSMIIPGGNDADWHLLNEYMRRSATPEDAAAQYLANSRLDVRALAPEVRAPTLVIHRHGDRSVPFKGGLEMAKLIPGARFMAFEGSNHVFFLGDPDAQPIYDAIVQFLDEDLPAR
jgi:pimeloyl-ACP methyl ester carboxylesterase/DNA-binding winged helix-turn-helix (wHTH) protein